jgi:RHS repeat-associated protein
VKTGTTRGWTYDANGNRLTETGASASTYTIASTNNRVSSISGALPRTYSYDTAGNVLTYATVTATYNNRGRMKTLTKGAVTATYVYNALGQFVKQSGGPSGTVLYVYDEAGHILGEYTSTGTLIQETIWMGDTPVATIRPGTPALIYYVHTDHLDTPRRITRPSDNKLMWTWYSDPFGMDLPNENPAAGGTFKYNLRFPGQIYDSHAGLNQNYFRDYDPQIGRYVQSDPIGLDGGINTYGYADANPISFADTLGLCAASPNMKRCLEKIFGSPVGSVRVRNKKVIGNNFVTTRRNVIRLPPSFPCEGFWSDLRLVLHEYFHVMRQWNVGRLSRRDYVREWLDQGSAAGNRFEDEANDFAREKLEEFKKCLLDQCPPSAN